MQHRRARAGAIFIAPAAAFFSVFFSLGLAAGAFGG